MKYFYKIVSIIVLAFSDFCIASPELQRLQPFDENIENTAWRIICSHVEGDLGNIEACAIIKALCGEEKSDASVFAVADLYTKLPESYKITVQSQVKAFCSPEALAGLAFNFCTIKGSFDKCKCLQHRNAIIATLGIEEELYPDPYQELQRSLYYCFAKACPEIALTGTWLQIRSAIMANSGEYRELISKSKKMPKQQVRTLATTDGTFDETKSRRNMASIIDILALEEQRCQQEDAEYQQLKRLVFVCLQNTRY